jgi:ADP-dependent NAD(P)H-hydrate dehydratase / NAD(P)H-hydrate epimerase
MPLPCPPQVMLVSLDRFSGAAVARLYTAAESRSLDRLAIEQHGIPGIVLMKRAGRAAWLALRRQWAGVERITVVCGRGNNAGDGYIVAGSALAQGVHAQLIQLGAAAALSGDAARARDWAVALGVEITEVDAEAPEFRVVGDVIVDALLGTGISGAVRPGYARAIATIAASGVPVLALDIPSGLCSDTGSVLGCAVHATLTVTFIGVKRGLVTGSAPDHTGRIELDTLELPDACYATVPGISALTWFGLRQLLRPRPATAYKQQSGHVLVVGGDLGMGGAIAMAGDAALRVGAGLVSAVTRPEHVAAILARRPEIMARGSADTRGLDALASRASVIAVGPGLGRDDWGQALFARVLQAGKPLVIDADALHLLVQHETPSEIPIVITPHAGEAAALLGRSAAEVQRDRFRAAAELAARVNGVAVLKGAGTVVADGADVGVCLHGNPAMASAGMGDVLTGIVAGLLAQGLTAADAAAAGVCLHSFAADRIVARRGGRGLLATDLLPELVAILNDREG